MKIEELNPLKRPHYLNCVYAMETIYDAYDKGFINRNVREKAFEKIYANMNGSWMFEQEHKENN